jgi:hypothetical protein
MSGTKFAYSNNFFLYATPFVSLFSAFRLSSFFSFFLLPTCITDRHSLLLPYSFNDAEPVSEVI